MSFLFLLFWPDRLGSRGPSPPPSPSNVKLLVITVIKQVFNPSPLRPPEGDLLTDVIKCCCLHLLLYGLHIYASINFAFKSLRTETTFRSRLLMVSPPKMTGRPSSVTMAALRMFWPRRASKSRRVKLGGPFSSHELSCRMEISSQVHCRITSIVTVQICML
jgi:hypothetical protein